MIQIFDFSIFVQKFPAPRSTRSKQCETNAKLHRFVCEIVEAPSVAKVAPDFRWP